MHAFLESAVPDQQLAYHTPLIPCCRWRTALVCTKPSCSTKSPCCKVSPGWQPYAGCHEEAHVPVTRSPVKSLSDLTTAFPIPAWAHNIAQLAQEDSKLQRKLHRHVRPITSDSLARLPRTVGKLGERCSLGLTSLNSRVRPSFAAWSYWLASFPPCTEKSEAQHSTLCSTCSAASQIST